MPERRINDIVIIQPIHTEKAKAIYQVSKEAKKIKGSIVICISGESGTGKTEITEELSKLYMADQKTCSIIKLDEYYRIPAILRSASRKEDFNIGLSEIDWGLVYNETADCIESGKEVVIIEGLYAIHAVGTFKVYLEGSIDETKEFRTMRKKEVIDELRQRVLRAEHLAVISLKDKADVLVTVDGNIK